MKVEVSTGEFYDKLSILTIKLEKIKDKEKLKNIQEEYDRMKPLIDYNLLEGQLYDSLLEKNRKLWDIEDKIRKKEQSHSFDEEFVELARSVYIVNDQRYYIKKSLNIITASEVVEEKEYDHY